MFKNPLVICSIILPIAFLVILIYNQKSNNKWIRIAFLILASCFLILLIMFDNDYVYELLKGIITYFWYPNYLIFVTIILISVIIFLGTFLSKKSKFKTRLSNSILFCLMFAIYNIYLQQNIDVTLYSELYSTLSLTLMRIATITFAIWVIVTIIFKIGDKKNEK